MKKRIICMMLLALTLCGCESNPAENSGTESSDSSASDCEVPDRDAETLPAETTTSSEVHESGEDSPAASADSAFGETDAESVSETQQEDAVPCEFSESDQSADLPADLTGDLLPRDNN